MKKISPIKVFTTFGSLGGSSEGYKRLGFEVIAYNEIDKKFFNFYMKKNSPKYGFNCDIRDLVSGKVEIPKELYGIDILDGSPPCSLFSISNVKSGLYKGKPKKFVEGQKEQILDELVEVYARLIDKIQPKIFVFENVPTIVSRKNRPYVDNFLKIIQNNYSVCTKIINSHDLGSAQSRQRFFIFGIRKDIASEDFCGGFDIDIPISTKKLFFKDISDESDKRELRKDTIVYNLWKNSEVGKTFEKTAKKILGRKSSFFNHRRCDPQKPVFTVLAAKDLYHPTIYRKLNRLETLRAFDLPEDFLGDSKLDYRYIGYMVPPIFYEKLLPEVIKKTTLWRKE